jgi:hypothetical protein
MVRMPPRYVARNTQAKQKLPAGYHKKLIDGQWVIYDDVMNLAVEDYSKFETALERAADDPDQLHHGYMAALGNLKKAAHKRREELQQDGLGQYRWMKQHPRVIDCPGNCSAVRKRSAERHKNNFRRPPSPVRDHWYPESVTRDEVLEQLSSLRALVDEAHRNVHGFDDDSFSMHSGAHSRSASPLASPRTPDNRAAHRAEILARAQGLTPEKAAPPAKSAERDKPQDSANSELLKELEQTKAQVRELQRVRAYRKKVAQGEYSEERLEHLAPTDLEARRDKEHTSQQLLEIPQVIGAHHSTSSQPDDRFNKCKWDVNSNAPVSLGMVILGKRLGTKVEAHEEADSDNEAGSRRPSRRSLLSHASKRGSQVGFGGRRPSRRRTIANNSSDRTPYDGSPSPSTMSLRAFLESTAKGKAKDGERGPRAATWHVGGGVKETFEFKPRDDDFFEKGSRASLFSDPDSPRAPPQAEAGGFLSGGFMSSAMNKLESMTGIDLDRDGDVGVEGSPKKSRATHR